MKTSKSYNLWLQTAHKLFAEKGPENFSIKEVAELSGLPRTNFYYHFDNKKELLDKAIELHFQTTTRIFNAELSKRLNVFIPDFYVVLYDFKLGMQFAKTLFKHRDIPRYNTAYLKGVALSADLIVPKFKQYFSIKLPDNQVKKLWYTLCDTWYSRIQFNDYSVEYLCDLCLEIMDTITPLIRKSHTQGKV